MSAIFSVQDVMKNGESFHLGPLLDEIKCTDYGEQPRRLHMVAKKYFSSSLQNLTAFLSFTT